MTGTRRVVRAPVVGIDLVPCVHTWMTRDGENHVHACAGRESCHPAPCVCRCFASDFCTAHPMHAATEPRHVTTPPSKVAP